MLSDNVNYLALYCCDTATTVSSRSVSISGNANFAGTGINPTNTPFANKYSAMLFTVTLKANVLQNKSK